MLIMSEPMSSGVPLPYSEVLKRQHHHFEGFCIAFAVAGAFAFLIASASLIAGPVVRDGVVSVRPEAFPLLAVAITLALGALQAHIQAKAVERDQAKDREASAGLGS